MLATTQTCLHNIQMWVAMSSTSLIIYTKVLVLYEKLSTSIITITIIAIIHGVFHVDEEVSCCQRKRSVSVACSYLSSLNNRQDKNRHNGNLDLYN